MSFFVGTTHNGGYVHETVVYALKGVVLFQFLISGLQWTEILRNANFALRNAKCNFAKFSVQISCNRK